MPDTVTDLLGKAGLSWPALQSFCSDLSAPWTTLLTALPILHPTPEDVAGAALPIIDAAWIHARGAKT